jgi:Fe-S oxidoreductase
VVEQPRRLLGEIAEDFREMPDAGMMNWCCGGGVSANARAEPLMR